MTSALAAFTPYSTVRELFAKGMAPTWIQDPLDQERIQSYQMYEQIYWSVEGTFSLVARSTEDKPIYLPTARTIVNTVDRYTMPDIHISLVKSMDEKSTGTDDGAAEANEYLKNFFIREAFWSMFDGNKLYGLIRGDWLWYLTADPKKVEGSRIKIRPLDPASYFPIWDEDDVDRINGCHIVDTFTDGDEKYIQRTTYRKPGLMLPGGLKPDPKSDRQWVTVESLTFDWDEKWQGPKPKVRSTVIPWQPLNGITSLPVYHIPNTDEPANPFGSSEIRGIERILGAINQATSDQELAMALDGLGMYWTDSPKPVNPVTGQTEEWKVGPGNMWGVPEGRTVNRLTGVSSVTPSLDHINFLIDSVREPYGVNGIAVGIADASAASGVSLALQLSPLISQSNKKDRIGVNKHEQMIFDLITQWFPAYEGAHFEGYKPSVIVGDKIPFDRAARVEELNYMLEKGIIDSAFYREEMVKLGWEFPADIDERARKEADEKAARDDPFANRSVEELASVAAGTAATSSNGQTAATGSN